MQLCTDNNEKQCSYRYTNVCEIKFAFAACFSKIPIKWVGNKMILTDTVPRAGEDLYGRKCEQMHFSIVAFMDKQTLKWWVLFL